MKLLLGDCVEEMKKLPENSVDAIVTDPPYGIAFMSKEFDSLGEGPAQQAWHLVWAREAFRVLKPGGHLLAFSGTRTYHRMACAIEDAGFEVRDQMQWLYGCLSEDTEVLVDGEWVHYRNATAGRLALCYDLEKDCYSWQPISEVVIYDYDDTAYRIRSERTDQIVSRNHRCLVRHDDESCYQFQYAEEAAREREVRVPVLQDLRGLLEALPVPQQASGCAEKDMLQGVLTRDPQKTPSEASDAGTPRHGPNPVRGVRVASLETTGMGEARKGPHVLQTVQRVGSWSGVGNARVEGGACSEDFRTYVRPQKSSMEGRGDIQAREGELQRGEVCALPLGVFRDGNEEWVRDGASAGRSEGARSLPTALGGGTPRQPHTIGQPSGEPDALCLESRSQAVRGEGFTRTDLALIEPFHLEGTVWCLRVPTGAFVVRRNGKVFVTGNSGFPKSMDVSKAFDKKAGAKREVVGVKPGHEGFTGGSMSSVQSLKGTLGGEGGFARPWMDDPEKVAAYHMRTAPATDLAKQWEGWGTALKPANEPIVVARKPLIGTVAANVEQYGTGAINIDGCRIPTADNLNGGAYSGGERPTSMMGATGEAGGTNSMFEQGGGRLDPTEFEQPPGRWPANVILSHHPDCVKVGTTKVRAITGGRTSGRNAPGQDSGWNQHNNKPTEVRRFAAADGTETVEAWECVEDCPVKLLDEQSGVTTSKDGSRGAGGQHGRFHPLSAQPEIKPGKGDTGGASRFFKVASWTKTEIDQLVQCAGSPCDCDGTASVPKPALAEGAPEDKPRSDSKDLSTVVTPTESEPKSGSSTEPILSFGPKFSPEPLPAKPTTSNNPASGVDPNPPTDTTTTTTNLSKSGSCVGSATSSTTSKSEDLGVAGSRFKYCAKASKKEKKAYNNHVTVKPIALMRYLCRLVTPPGGVVLDPFTGSGTTGIAAHAEGFEFIGIERDAAYMEIAKRRISEAGHEGVEDPQPEPASEPE